MIAEGENGGSFNVLFATWPGLCFFLYDRDKESNEYDYGPVKKMWIYYIPLTLMENG
jgi:hypothetical protein